MNNDNDNNKTVIDHALERSAEAPVPPEVETRLRARLAGFRQKLESECGVTPSYHRHWVLRSAFAAMICLALAAALWVTLLGGGQQSLYAQAIQAIEEAKTIHATGNVWLDGQWITQTEVWYDRDHGLLMKEERGGRTRAFLDNGVYQWEYQSDKGSAVRKPSRSGNMTAMLDELFGVDRILNRAQRDPNGDRDIEGVSCRLYTKSFGDGNGRGLVWLDDQNLVRRFEEHILSDGQWQNDELCTVEYDVPMDASRFELDVPPDTRLVEIDPPPGDRFVIDDGIYSQEILGLIVTVHEVKRVEGGLIYIVHSVRPTEETEQRFGRLRKMPRHGGKRYGDTTITSGWRRLENDKWRSHQAVSLAKHRTEDGADVTWSLLIPEGDWPDRVDTLDLSMKIFAREELQDAYEAQGLEWHKRFRPLTTLPLPEVVLVLDEVLTDIHTRIQALAVSEVDSKWPWTTLPGRMLPLTEQKIQQRVKFGEKEEDLQGLHSRRNHRPLDVPLEDYLEDMHADLEWYAKPKKPGPG